MKKLLKKIGNKPWAQKTAGVLAAGFLWLIFKSCRFDRIGFDYVEECQTQGRSLLGTIWHSRLVFSPFAVTPRKNYPLYALISRHRDGRMIAEVVKTFGFDTIDGSTNTHGDTRKGGIGATKGILRHLTEETCGVMICPDGPRGPAFKMSMGALFVARETGLPLVPTAGSAARAKIFNTWDKFMLPAPFSRGVFMCGEPLSIPKNASDEEMERLRQVYEKRMNDLIHEADKRTGRIKDDAAL